MNVFGELNSVFLIDIFRIDLSIYTNVLSLLL